MNENKTKIIVLDETGNEKEAEILSAFSIKKYNKNYILYTLNEVDENDMIKIYASELIEKDNMYSLGVIESDEICQNEIIPVILSDNNNMELKTLFNDIQQTFDVGMNTQTVISGDYNDLSNKPQINGVVLEGDKTFADLHFNSLQPDQIEDIWNEL